MASGGEADHAHTARVDPQFGRTGADLAHGFDRIVHRGLSAAKEAGGKSGGGKAVHHHESVEAERCKPARDLKSLFADDQLGIAASRENQGGPSVGSFRDNAEAARTVNVAHHKV